MGKIHEALEKAGRAADLKAPRATAAPAAKPRPLKKELNVVTPREENLHEETPPVARKTHAIDSTLVTYHDPSSVEAEIFKILRTNILFPKVGKPPQSIMVTSAIPADGKSFVAANLAISIAQGIEEHVLLMDCDMRRSSIHKRFGFGHRVPGLSDYLSDKVPLESLLKKTDVDKLTILPGGPPPRNPSELLSSQAMEDLLKETTSRYKDRFIVVDSPPPQLTAETAALANYIDGIIIVIRYGTTPRQMVKDLVENIGKEKVLGVVMNGYRVPVTERYGYGKYNRYKYNY